MTETLPTPSVSELLTKLSMQIIKPTPGLVEYQAAVVTLAEVFTRIVETPCYDDFMMVWNFFDRYSTSSLRESEILKGAHILVGGDKLKFFLVYSLFIKAIQGTYQSQLALLMVMVIDCPELLSFLHDQSEFRVRAQDWS
jgi:hypothetical protein